MWSLRSIFKENGETQQFWRDHRGRGLVSANPKKAGGGHKEGERGGQNGRLRAKIGLSVTSRGVSLRFGLRGRRPSIKKGDPLEKRARDRCGYHFRKRPSRSSQRTRYLGEGPEATLLSEFWFEFCQHQLTKGGFFLRTYGRARGRGDAELKYQFRKTEKGACVKIKPERDRGVKFIART